MIFVQLNKADFEYDIHSLVKAFYPSENVSVSAYDPEDDVLYRYLNSDKKIEDPVKIVLEVEYKEQGAVLALKEPEETGGRLLREAASTTFEADDADRKTTKNLLKQHLYKLLSAHTGRELPWGTLTGIRPVKIPRTMLEAGRTEQEVEAYMKDTYGTSKEKIRLSIDIAKKEMELLGRLDPKEGYSLYVGIPFCPSTCLYCSFTSYPFRIWESRIGEYLDALEREIGFTAEWAAGKHLNSIYIGGGTPTTLAPSQLQRLLVKIEQSFDLSHLLEYTVEAGRPDSITAEKLEVLKAHGATRISVNPQTMKQETLDLIGRHHTVRQTVDRFHLARNMGFDNINMDLIMGLPQETLEDVRHTMEALQELGPDSVTVHSLAVKRAARLNMEKELYGGYQMINTQEHLDTAASACSRMGMQPYYLYRQKNMAGNFENVGYAKKGKEGIYNVLIMEEVQTILALGAGTITKRVHPEKGIQRCENVKDVAQYIARIGEMIERKKKLLMD